MKLHNKDDQDQKITQSSRFTRGAVPKHQCWLKSPGGFVKTQRAVPHPQSSSFSRPGVGAQELTFVTSSWVMPRLLVWGPHFEDHCTGENVRLRINISWTTVWIWPKSEHCQKSKIGYYWVVCPKSSCARAKCIQLLNFKKKIFFFFLM